MQQELKELQPELIETSKETEQLIKIIADETLEVEDKKQVNIIHNLFIDSHYKTLAVIASNRPRDHGTNRTRIHEQDV